MLQLGLLEDLSQTIKIERVKILLEERDITSFATIPESLSLIGQIRAKSTGVIAGSSVAAAIFKLVNPEIHINTPLQDGKSAERGELILQVEGSGRSLLVAERTALNFLGRMSGIATLTHLYVETIAGTQAVILDTRKTVPGMRYLDKYAVRIGGGQNHRMGLFDMILIKDNHIDGAGGIEQATKRVRDQYGNIYPIEIEVKNLDELRVAIDLKVNRIMLDNMDIDTLRRAVEITEHRIPLEASGNVNLSTVRAIAETGVDFISVGALTHSAPVLDISMRLG